MPRLCPVPPPGATRNAVRPICSGASPFRTAEARVDSRQKFAGGGDRPVCVASQSRWPVPGKISSAWPPGCSSTRTKPVPRLRPAVRLQRRRRVVRAGQQPLIRGRWFRRIDPPGRAVLLLPLPKLEPWLARVGELAPFVGIPVIPPRHPFRRPAAVVPAAAAHRARRASAQRQAPGARGKPGGVGRASRHSPRPATGRRWAVWAGGRRHVVPNPPAPLAWGRTPCVPGVVTGPPGFRGCQCGRAAHRSGRTGKRPAAGHSAAVQSGGERVESPPAARRVARAHQLRDSAWLHPNPAAN